jgi:hypothetical protein
MKKPWVAATTSLLAVSLFVGCSSEPETSGERERHPLPPPPGMSGMSGLAPQDAWQTMDTAAESAPADSTQQQAPGEAEAPSEPETPPAEPAAGQNTGQGTQRVKADVGVGKAGRSLDEYEGVIVTPAKALFTVREKAVFQIQIPNALQLYKATNGSNPKTHEEFMAQVIEANSIQLPELPAGQRYVWDPEQGELMVEKGR